MIRLAISAVIGIGIFGAQFCLAALARALTPPWTPFNLIPQVLTNPWLYLGTICYAISIGLYIWLLRTGAISTTNLPIMAILVALNLALAFTHGEGLNATQIAGAAMAGIGLILMQNG